LTTQEYEDILTSDCERCHRRGSLALVMNTGLNLLFQCTGCRCEVAYSLPVVAKKVVYLDQFVLSNIVKAKEARWEPLHARLVELAAMQLIVCPFSEVHREESLLDSRWRDRFKMLYRSIGGVGFRLPEEIEAAQLLSAMCSWLGSPGPTVGEAAWEESFETDPHRWTCTPAFFEGVVVKLLMAMGYGGVAGQGTVTGKSGDGGIDGVIRQDKMGLEVVCIQSKR
jgi:hypothetical protein